MVDQNSTPQIDNDEISLKELILKIKEWYQFLLTQWKLIILMGLGLASSLGIDLGSSAGGAFAGSNLIELMKSRKLIEKTLLSPITVNGKTQSLADYYLEFNEVKKGWDEKPFLKGVNFPIDADREKFTLQQDSILKGISTGLVKTDVIVSQKDKKISILSIEVN
jgi:hypothetical protein